MGSTTAEAATIVQQAFAEARDLRSRVVGQEHVLLVLAGRTGSMGVAVLEALGLAAGLDSFRMWITPGPEGAPPPEPTPRLRKALEEADADAGRRDRAATSADLVTGILRAEIGVGYQLLRAAGVSLESARAAVERLPHDHDELTDVVGQTLVATLDQGPPS